MTVADLLIDCRNRLGEGCFVDPRDGCLWWTDIEGSGAYRRDAAGNVTRFVLPGRAGFILPRREPGFVIGFPNQIVLADQDLRVFTRPTISSRRLPRRGSTTRRSTRSAASCSGPSTRPS